MFKAAFTAAILAVASTSMSHAGATAPTEQIVLMQAQMQAYINNNLIDGALLNLDESTGKIRPLYPAKAHPKIMSLGPYYVLCADFRDESGKDVMVNFFLAKDKDRVVVFHTTYGNDEELEQLVKSGTVKAVN